MRGLSWVLLMAVGLVLSNDDKDMSSVEWTGGETILNSATGEKCYNGVATRAQIHENYAYITIPKLKPTVKASCCKLDMTKEIGKETKHILKPFPPEHPSQENCQGLLSAVDLWVDHKDILWVLDNGGMVMPPTSSHHSPSEHHQPHMCPPKVVAYDITTGDKLHEFNLMEFVSPISRLQFIICDYSHDGHPYVYVTDAGGKAIILWDVKANQGTKMPLPDAILNEYAMRDVLYVFLIRKASGKNKLYFTYRSGESLWCIDTIDIQTDKSMDKAYEIAKKPAKIIILGTDDWDCMYFRYEPNADVYKWSTDTEFTESNFFLVHKSENSHLTPTHAITDYQNGVMRLLESNLQDCLRPDFPAEEAINSLTVMSVTDHSSSPESM